MSNYAICSVHLFQNGTLINGKVIDQQAEFIETGTWQEVILTFSGQDTNGNARALALVCQPDVNVWVAVTAETLAGGDPVQGIKVLSGETAPLGILSGQRVFVRTV
jgi:hypothetical protein